MKIYTFLTCVYLFLMFKHCFLMISSVLIRLNIFINFNVLKYLFPSSTFHRQTKKAPLCGTDPYQVHNLWSKRPSTKSLATAVNFFVIYVVFIICLFFLLFIVFNKQRSLLIVTFSHGRVAFKSKSEPFQRVGERYTTNSAPCNASAFGSELEKDTQTNDRQVMDK